MKPACREPDGSRDVPRDVPDGVALALKRTEYPEYGSHLDTRKGQVDSLREEKDLTSMQCKEPGTDQLISTFGSSKYNRSLVFFVPYCMR